MKASLVRDGVCVLLGSVLTLAVVFSVRGALQDAVAQGGGGDVPIGNGDVNGDGEIDLSDAIYILDSLFSGGPDVVPIECPPASGGGLPDTGQTTCYDESGAEIPCDSATCPGQDGAYQTGCSNEGRFVDNGDGTVTDNCTGLMWQKDTADVDGDGTISPAPGAGDSVWWGEALVYCDELTLAGYEDWRLPNIRELQTIVDYGRLNPAIDPVFGAESYNYWSSTSHGRSNPANAFSLVFSNGVVLHGSKATYWYFVRAVRTIQPGE